MLKLVPSSGWCNLRYVAGSSSIHKHASLKAAIPGTSLNVLTHVRYNLLLHNVHVTRPIWTHCRSRLYSCAQSTSRWCFTMLERRLLRCEGGRWQSRGGQWHKGSQQGPRAGVARFPTHCCATKTRPIAALHLVCLFCLWCKLLLWLFLQSNASKRKSAHHLFSWMLCAMAPSDAKQLV